MVSFLGICAKKQPRPDVSNIWPDGVENYLRTEGRRRQQVVVARQ